MADLYGQDWVENVHYIYHLVWNPIHRRLLLYPRDKEPDSKFPLNLPDSTSELTRNTARGTGRDLRI